MTYRHCWIPDVEPVLLTAGHKGLHGFLYGEEGAEAHDDTEEENLARVSCRAAQFGVMKP